MESVSVGKQDPESRASVMASLWILLVLLSEFGKYFIPLAFGLLVRLFSMFHKANICFQCLIWPSATCCEVLRHQSGPSGHHGASGPDGDLEVLLWRGFSHVLLLVPAKVARQTRHRLQSDEARQGSVRLPFIQEQVCGGEQRENQPPDHLPPSPIRLRGVLLRDLGIQLAAIWRGDFPSCQDGALKRPGGGLSAGLGPRWHGRLGGAEL